jgi:hypothetical protein
VHRLRVRAGKIQVAQRHRQATVVEHPLQCEDVAAVAQVLDGEGVAEAMGVDIIDASPSSQPMHERPDGQLDISLLVALLKLRGFLAKRSASTINWTFSCLTTLILSRDIATTARPS